MSLVDVDSWVTEYEACDRLSHNIDSQLVQREQSEKLSSEYSQLTRNIQICLNQFETELAQLINRLRFSSNRITFEENERRQHQLNILQSKLSQQKRRFTANVRSETSNLLQRTSGPRSTWHQPDLDDDPPIIESNKNVGVEELKQRQIQFMVEQNRGLEVLSQTISRQRELATQLGHEVEDQNEIIDNLANTMEQIETRVSVETSNIGLIGRRDNTCGYWIIIVALFMLIVFVSAF